MIATVVTRGYGNGTFNGTIPLVATRGYAVGAELELWTVQTPSIDNWSVQSASSDTWTIQTPSTDTWTEV